MESAGIYASQVVPASFKKRPFRLFNLAVVFGIYYYGVKGFFFAFFLCCSMSCCISQSVKFSVCVSYREYLFVSELGQYEANIAGAIFFSGRFERLSLALRFASKHRVALNTSIQDSSSFISRVFFVAVLFSELIASSPATWSLGSRRRISRLDTRRQCNLWSVCYHTRRAVIREAVKKLWA